MGHKDLRFGQIVYILVLNISFFWLFPLEGFQIFFWALFIAWQWKRRIPCAWTKLKTRWKLGRILIDILGTFLIKQLLTSLAPDGYDMAIYHLISNAPTGIIFKSPAVVEQIWKNFAILNWWYQCSKAADCWTINREDLGTRLCYFGRVVTRLDTPKPDCHLHYKYMIRVL